MNADLSEKLLSEKEQWTPPKMRKNSEEILSDQLSSSDSDEQRDTNAITTTKTNQRKSQRNTKKRKWPKDYFESDNFETDDDRKDTDPMWKPLKHQVASLPPTKKTFKKEERPKTDGAQSNLNTKITENCKHSNNPSELTPLNGNHSALLSFVGYSTGIKDGSFDSGKFIMLKSDFKWQKSPCLWRIDGKNLLQKYEPISHEGAVAYRNISTYSSWTVNNKGLYIPIEAEFSYQSKTETVVTFDPESVVLPIGIEVSRKICDEGIAISDTFKVYLQTLLSQALDSNFLVEIAKEKDEYFLTSIAAVEEHWVCPRLAIFAHKITWKKDLLKMVEMHPVFDLSCVTSGEKTCDSCGGRNPTRKFHFQCRTYEIESLRESESNKLSPRMYLLCLSCTDHVILYHQLRHMRFELFSGCRLKVNEHMNDNPEADGPTTLKSCLADHQWTTAMHKKVLLILAETEQIISQANS